MKGAKPVEQGQSPSQATTTPDKPVEAGKRRGGKNNPGGQGRGGGGRGNSGGRGGSNRGGGGGGAVEGVTRGKLLTVVDQFLVERLFVFFLKLQVRAWVCWASVAVGG